MWSWHFSSFSLCLYWLTSSKLARDNLIEFCKKTSCLWQSGCRSPHQFLLLFRARGVTTALPIYPTVPSLKNRLNCAWKYFICSIWGTSKTQSSFNPVKASASVLALTTSAKLQMFHVPFPSFGSSLIYARTPIFLSHLISTAISQEYPSFFPCRWDLIWL